MAYLKLFFSIAYFITEYSGMMFLFEKEYCYEIFRFFNRIHRVAEEPLDGIRMLEHSYEASGKWEIDHQKLKL